MRKLLAPPAIVLLLTAAAVLPAGPAHAATWTTPSTPNASTGMNVLTGVDAVASTAVWAVGHADHSPSTPFQRPLVLRWNGSAWAVSATPGLASDGALRGVDGSSATNVWAVGSRTVPAGGGSVTSAPLAERWNGTSWAVVPAPAPSGAIGAGLEGVKTLAGNNAWAVGSYGASTPPGSRTLIQQWNGSVWTTVASPNPDPNTNLLSDIDGTAGDLWAIGNMGNDGYGGTVAGFVLRRTGGAWTRVNVPGATGDATLRQPVLNDVHAVSAGDVWIVGRAFHFGLFKMVPIWMHWNGTTWTNGFVNGAPAGGFNAVTSLSSSRVYATGDVTARWNGTAWALESTSFAGPPLDAAAVAGTGTVWGVGYRYDAALAQYRTLSVRTTNG